MPVPRGCPTPGVNPGQADSQEERLRKTRRGVSGADGGDRGQAEVPARRPQVWTAAKGVSFRPLAADNFRPVPPPRAATPDFVFSPVSMKTLLFYLLKNNKATTYISRLV